MKKARAPRSINPYVSFLSFESSIHLFQHEEMMQAMLDFTLQQEEIKTLQSESSLLMQSAQFEKTFTKYVQPTNVSACVLDVKTIDVNSNYKL